MKKQEGECEEAAHLWNMWHLVSRALDLVFLVE